MHIEKELYTNDPVGAFLTLKGLAYDHDRFTIEEYMVQLSRNVWKFHSLGLDIQGNSLEEKCASCLEQLVQHGLIELTH